MGFPRVFLALSILIAALHVPGCATAGRDYEQAIQAGTIPAFERFVAKHPDSQYTPAARAKLAAMRAEKAWKRATRAGDIGAYEAFLDEHGKSTQAPEARQRLESLKLDRDWDEVQQAREVAAYEGFLERHSDSKYAGAARRNLAALRADRGWAAVRDSADIGAYEAFLEEHGNSAHADEAKAKLEDLRIAAAFGSARAADTAEAYKAFIEKYPGSKYAKEAQKRYDDLTRPPLIAAARNDDLDQVRARIAAGDDVNEQWRGTTALMYAAFNGNLEMVRHLLDQGADIQAHNRRESALMLADYGNYIGKQTPAQAQIVELLVREALKELEQAPTAKQIREYVLAALKASQAWQGNGGVQLFLVSVEDAEKGTIRVRAAAATWGDVGMYEVATINNAVMPEPPDKTIYTHVAFAGSDNLQFIIAPTGKDPAWSIEAVRVP